MTEVSTVERTHLEPQMFVRRAAAIVLVIVAAGLFAACGGLRSEVHGSGTVVTQSRSVSGFDRIAISGPGIVSVTLAETESLQIEAEDNILEVLNSSVSDGRLKLDHDGFTSIVPTKPIVYRIGVRQLHEISVSGSAEAIVTVVDEERFEVSISGSGSVEPEGITRLLAVNISGSGTFRGDALRADVADVSVSGSGEATVNALDELTAAVSGSGAITYLGDPVVHQTISGSGSITRR